MNVIFASFIGGWEMVLILAVVLVLFGAKKLPELAKGLGQGIKEFKKATREVQDEINSAIEDTPPQRRYIPPATEPHSTPDSMQPTSSQPVSSAAVPGPNPSSTPGAPQVKVI